MLEAFQQKLTTRYHGPIERIAVHFAMQAEADPFIESLKLSPCSPIERLPYLRLHAGKIDDVEIWTISNGIHPDRKVDRVGTETSTLAAFKLIEISSPSILINAGTAGAFRHQGSNIGDVFVSEGAIFHDHRIPIPGFKEFAEGNFRTVDCSKLREMLGLKSGLISTGSSLDMGESDISSFRRTGAAVKEMEAAAVAQVAQDQNVPFFAVKSITDFADQPCNHEDFLQNLASASRALQKKLVEIVRQLCTVGKLEDI